VTTVYDRDWSNAQPTELMVTALEHQTPSSRVTNVVIESRRQPRDYYMAVGEVRKKQN
jgi:hypothetical protein